jgi:hypothetical protein
VNAYPGTAHATSKEQVKKELGAALPRAGDAERIIAAARSYAELREGEDPRFTKSAAKWLREDCWDFDAAPAPDGPMIDEAGNVVPLPGFQRRPRSRGDALFAAGLAVDARRRAARGRGEGV